MDHDTSTAVQIAGCSGLSGLLSLPSRVAEGRAAFDFWVGGQIDAGTSQSTRFLGHEADSPNTSCAWHVQRYAGPFR